METVAASTAAMMMVLLVKEEVPVSLQSGGSYWEREVEGSLDAELFNVQPA